MAPLISVGEGGFLLGFHSFELSRSASLTVTFITPPYCRSSPSPLPQPAPDCSRPQPTSLELRSAGSFLYPSPGFQVQRATVFWSHYPAGRL
ncbi:unnamed protein product [Boreogadus saida]